MIEKTLKKDLLEKLNVTPQRLSQRAKRMKEEHGPMSTEEAVYVIAHVEGLDVSKYLSAEETSRVRELVPRVPGKSAGGGRSSEKRRQSRQVMIKIGSDAPAVDALLSTTMAKDAAKMAEIYPKFYVFENSLRCVIMRMLETAHGADWWTSRTPPAVQRGVEGRKREEEKRPWHGKRGQHEIFYSDFKDLRRLIDKNWPVFEPLFPNRPWITRILDELEPLRNVLAHHNPIGERDQKRLEIYFADWLDLLQSKRSLFV